jgi:hypothetical protein
MKMGNREQDMWSSGLFLGAFALLYLYGKVFSVVVKGLYLFLRWAWRKYPGFCNGTLATALIAAASYGATYCFLWLPVKDVFQWFEFAWWLPHAVSIVATGAYLWHKIQKARPETGQKKAGHVTLQPAHIEYNAVEAPGQKIVRIRNLRGNTSPALHAELKRQGLDGLMREAKKVPWADQVILASATPVQPIQRMAVGENRIHQRPRVKSKLRFEGCEPKTNRSLPPRF